MFVLVQVQGCWYQNISTCGLEHLSNCQARTTKKRHWVLNEKIHPKYKCKT